MKNLSTKIFAKFDTKNKAIKNCMFTKILKIDYINKSQKMLWHINVLHPNIHA